MQQEHSFACVFTKFGQVKWSEVSIPSRQLWFPSLKLFVSLPNSNKRNDVFFTNEVEIITSAVSPRASTAWQKKHTHSSPLGWQLTNPSLLTPFFQVVVTTWHGAYDSQLCSHLAKVQPRSQGTLREDPGNEVGQSGDNLMTSRFLDVLLAALLKKMG